MNSLSVSRCLSASRLGLRFLLIGMCALSIFPFTPAHAEPAQEPTARGNLKSGAEARLLIPSPFVDFGSVPEGTSVTKSFEIRNVGSAPLEILKMYPSCGCTVAKLVEPVVAAGESTTIDVTFDTQGFQGEKQKTVRIYTNDPTKPSALLNLKGTVVADFEISKQRVNFGIVSKGDVKALEVEVTSKQGSGVHISDVGTRSEGLDISTSDYSKNGQIGKTIRIALKPTIPIGIFQERVIVRTSSEKNPVVIVPVFAKVIGDVKLVPTDISFGLITGELLAPLVRSIKIVNQGSNTVKITKVQTDNDFIETKLKTASDKANEFELIVTLLPGATGTIKSKITITTTHPDEEQQTLIIPVYGIIGQTK